MAKLKLKSHSGAKKRLSKTKSGRFKAVKAGRRHLLAAKSERRTRRMKASAYIHPTMEHRMERLLPYA